MDTKYHVSSRPREDLCPVTETIKIIGKKWYLIILHELTKKPMGFNDLKRAVRGISAKVLSESLTDLGERGLVERLVHSESPIRVEYRLLEKGRELEEVFHVMKAWGERWAICETGGDARASAPAAEVSGDGSGNGHGPPARL